MSTASSAIPICRRQPPSTRQSIIGRFLTTLALYNCVERDIIVSGLRLWQTIRGDLFKDAEKFKLGYHRLDLYTGSFCEGMPEEVCGDIDVMFIMYNWPAVLFDNPTNPENLSNGYLLAEGVPGKPAFLRLKAPPRVGYVTNPRGRYSADITKAFMDVGETEWRYVSSSKFVELNYRDGDDTHGPAGTRPVEPKDPAKGMTDNVPCLGVPNWPPCASEFLTRPRPHGWPSPELIDSIAQAGCHVVGVGQPQSSPEDKQIEWRWSFSMAERELIHNFTDDMAACMYLLKAFKNKYWYDDEIVCSEDKEPSIFCSYFFKTACLWVFERTRLDESDAISFCRKVFDWLISWL